MMNRKWNEIFRRAASGLLALILAVGLLPAELAIPAHAAEESWAQPYLEKLVSWGVMRGDQDGSLAPDRAITRAEYVTMINRAYGYDEVGPTPFTDVLPSDWFAEDIGIAYTVGYFAGTSANLASPNSQLTREEATLILGRNMMLQESVGESMDFTDSRALGEWSRGIVKAAAEGGLVNGYPDGTFRPQNSITRGEVAALLVSAVGVPIQEPGEYNLGGVYGNVTISSSGVTLRNTTISGDLYITGGVGLGYVTLENVTVLGKIIASGAGESNKGGNSLVLRNVEAEELVVDSLANQFVTLRAEGNTEIATTSVRTSSYLEDVTPIGLGLQYIELNGENGTRLELAGSIGEVANMTPGSYLVMAQGSAAQITVDEKATGSRLTVENGAEVKTLNLDVGTAVSGAGDVDNLNVNTGGSTVGMLPDTITVRPGVTANVSGETMDTVIAAEASADPRILSGYPDIRDVAPTTAAAVFSANKRGTIYWGVSAISDGSVSEADLISPPAYGSKLVASGTAQVSASSTEVTGRITRLTSDGSYYLSAVLVDSRGEHSPLKVNSFSTPDDTTPNFASGYPVMTKITKDSAQVMVMPTKSCQLYYAVLPKGSTAPKAADFKAGAVTGNKGYGTLDVTKNTTRIIDVNRDPLVELETYDLYLWLTDFDGAKSSAVKKITFTTVDGTPPQFNTAPRVTGQKNTSISLGFNLNEAGTLYWVAVATGTEYPKPMANQSGKVELDSLEAKLQVSNGMNALKSGRVNAAANKDVTFNVTGLTEQSTYDIYYVAVDKAGNYADRVGVITANTLDDKAPLVTQEFTRYNGNDKTVPLADTDVRLVFSEGVQEADTRYNTDGKSLLALYQEVDAAATDQERENAVNTLADVLRRTILLYDATTVGDEATVRERLSDSTENWVIDYRKVEVTLEDGKTVVTFRNNAALNLSSGSSYYFKIQGLADTSSSKNLMGVVQLPQFTTVFAQVNLKNTGGGDTDADVELHMTFELYPVSTQKVADSIFWDMHIWSDTNVAFQLYRRVKNRDGSTAQPWGQVGNRTQSIVSTGDFDGLSLTRHFVSDSRQPSFDRLNTLDDGQVYEYGVHFTQVEGAADSATWSETVNFRVTVAAASNASSLANLSANITPASWADAKDTGGVTSIGLPDDFTIRKVFTDQKAPIFVDDYPEFEVGDSSAVMNLLLDRPGTIYYAVAPVGMVTTRDADGNEINASAWETVPESGKRNQNEMTSNASHVFPLMTPGYLDITNPRYSNSAIKTGYKQLGTGVVEIQVDGLLADTEYLVYFVMKGTGQVFSEQVLCYRFKTEKVVRPVITLEVSNPEVSVRVDRSSTVDYLLVVDNFTDTILEKKMDDIIADGKDEEWSKADHPDGKDEEWSKADHPDGYTVMDALLEDYKIGDKVMGSVFDYFAGQDTKNQLADLIRNRNVNSDSITMKRTISVSGGKTTYVDCTPGMSGITRYTFLAVGRSDMGSGDAFRAIKPVFLRDSDPPKVVSVSLEVEGDLPKRPQDTLKGTLTIQFNKNLYWYDRDKSSNRKIILLESLIIKNAYVTLGYATSPLPIGVDVWQPDTTPTASTPPTSVIRFTLDGVRDGAIIAIPNNLSNATGSTRSEPLSIEFVYEKITEGEETYYRPTVKITPAWDAR